MRLRTWCGSIFETPAPARLWWRFLLGWLRLLVRPWDWGYTFELWRFRPAMPPLDVEAPTERLVSVLLDEAQARDPAHPVFILHARGTVDDVEYDWTHSFDDLTLAADLLETTASEFRRRAARGDLQ